MAHWRVAGLSFLQQANVATTALRNCVKAPLREELLKRESIDFLLADYKAAMSKGINIKNIQKGGAFSWLASVSL